MPARAAARWPPGRSPPPPCPTIDRATVRRRNFATPVRCCAGEGHRVDSTIEQLTIEPQCVSPSTVVARYAVTSVTSAPAALRLSASESPSGRTWAVQYARALQGAGVSHRSDHPSGPVIRGLEVGLMPLLVAAAMTCLGRRRRSVGRRGRQIVRAGHHAADERRHRVGAREHDPVYHRALAAARSSGPGSVGGPIRSTGA